MRRRKRTSIRQSVLQVVTGSKPPSEVLEEMMDTCAAWCTAAGGWILVLMLAGPFVWVGWCALALRYLEYIGSYYPMLMDNWLWLCLVVGFFSVPILATFAYLDQKTQFVAMLLEEDVPTTAKPAAENDAKDKLGVMEMKVEEKEVVTSGDSVDFGSAEAKMPEDLGRVAPQPKDEVTGERVVRTEVIMVEREEEEEVLKECGATGLKEPIRQKAPERERHMEKEVMKVQVADEKFGIQTQSGKYETRVLGPDTRSKFCRMSEEEKRMARLRAFGLVHSILVLAFVWMLTEAYVRVNYDTDFTTVRSYGLWLVSGFRGLSLFAFTTTMTGLATVASRFFMKSKAKGKEYVHLRRRQSQQSRQSSPPPAQTPPREGDTPAHSGTQVKPIIAEALDKITPKGSSGKEQGREALFWLVCVGLNICTVQGLAALLFYTPVWARSLIAPA